MDQPEADLVHLDQPEEVEAHLAAARERVGPMAASQALQVLAAAGLLQLLPVASESAPLEAALPVAQESAGALAQEPEQAQVLAAVRARVRAVLQ